MGGGVSNPFRAGRDSSGQHQRQGDMERWLVSNPFRAGRDSSVVSLLFSRKRVQVVSNPFRAGRDSSEAIAPEMVLQVNEFQTPSERGGIPLALPPGSWCSQSGRFKPLQSGAGFLCSRFRPHGWAGLVFQTPSERGGIPLKRQPCLFQVPKEEVSNPFRAGRDSSGDRRRYQYLGVGVGFKPLQSGAGFL